MISYLDFLKEEVFESAHDIGDPVSVTDGNNVFLGNVRTVTFTSSKVRYSVFLTGVASTLHNLDSWLVKPNPNGTKLDMPPDNYS